MKGPVNKKWVGIQPGLYYFAVISGNKAGTFIDQHGFEARLHIVTFANLPRGFTS